MFRLMLTATVAVAFAAAAPLVTTVRVGEDSPVKLQFTRQPFRYTVLIDNEA